MTTRQEIYKCAICGQVVEVLTAGGGVLVCCGQMMTLLAAGSDDGAAVEKHVPVIEKTETGYVVKVGAAAHPMSPEHHIEWIELLVDGKSYRAFLEPEGEARAEFLVKHGEQVRAREYCNLHGLWEN